jgi:hypothetical protein
MELIAQLYLPLFRKVRRAEDGQPFDLTAVDEFSRYKARFDRLANAYVVCDK